MPIPATVTNTPVLRGVIGAWRQAFGLMMNSMKKVESAFIDPATGVSTVPLWSGFGEQMVNARQATRQWMDVRTQALNKIGSRFKMGDGEDILASIINDDPSNFGYNLSPKNQKVAKDMEKWMMETLQDAGLDENLARTFLKKDLPALRGVNGDMNRLSPMDLYPISFQPFFKDLQDGVVGAGQNNVYAFAHDLMHLSARAKYLNPAAKEAYKALNQMTRKLGPEDRSQVEFLAHTMLRDITEFRPKATEQAVVFINKFLDKFKKVGIDAQLDPNTAARWAMNMTSWYGGVAMAARPALVARNMTQLGLPALKVGMGELGPALKEVYGPGRKEIIKQALKDLGIPESGENLAFFGQEGATLGGRILPLLRAAQKQGLRPYRWADRVNNRVTTYRMGYNSVRKHGQKFIDGKMTWDDFLMETGLQGSYKSDQMRIANLLKGKEIGNLDAAAREYGKTLVQDTQFIYDGINAPLSFRGNMGRLFGQFGTWPIAFTEFMWQNAAGGGGADWGTKFLSRYLTQRAAFTGLGLGLGVDTSSWNYAFPLTFQGGPWFQAMRDVAVLGTSQNEFDRRKARSTVNRMLGSMGTPFSTSVFNPLGGVTTDFLQARAETDPVHSALLALGFNLRTEEPALRR